MKMVESYSMEIKLMLGWGTLEMGRQMSAGGTGEWDACDRGSRGRRVCVQWREVQIVTLQ